MKEKIIDGKMVANNLYENLKLKVQKIEFEKNIQPRLDIILANKNKDSELYVGRKIEIARGLGVDVKLHKFDGSIEKADIIHLIDKLNHSKDVHGIIIQLPMFQHLDQLELCNMINFAKDVDGLSAVNMGKLFLGFDKKKDFFHVSCTPLGCMMLLDEYKLSVAGKKCIILNRSNIVGKPLIACLLKRDAMVQVVHSKVEDFSDELYNADFIFSAVGMKDFIKMGMIKHDAVIFDIGINFSETGNLCGDVDFENCYQKASFITPVPGGVGQMTIAGLMSNVVDACEYLTKDIK